MVTKRIAKSVVFSLALICGVSRSGGTPSPITPENLSVLGSVPISLKPDSDKSPRESLGNLSTTMDGDLDRCDSAPSVESVGTNQSPRKERERFGLNPDEERLGFGIRGSEVIVPGFKPINVNRILEARYSTSTLEVSKPNSKNRQIVEFWAREEAGGRVKYSSKKIEIDLRGIKDGMPLNEIYGWTYVRGEIKFKNPVFANILGRLLIISCDTDEITIAKCSTGFGGIEIKEYETFPLKQEI